MRIGDLRLHPISDGTFVARPSYFGEHLAPDARPEVFDRHHTASLPIGCFLIRTGDRVVLVDAGLGPGSRHCPTACTSSVASFPLGYAPSASRPMT